MGKPAPEDNPRGKSNDRTEANDSRYTGRETVQTAPSDTTGGEDRDLHGFTEPPCGIIRYSQFLRHFPMEATQHDPETHSISFNLPSLPLTRDRNGHPYIADLAFQLLPGILFHTYCEKAERSLWSPALNRMVAQRNITNVGLKMCLKIDPAMYKVSTNLTGLAVDLRLRKGGSKHFHVSQDYWTSDRGVRVMRALSVGVFMDLDTRKVLELPSQLVTSLLDLEPRLIPDIWHHDLPAPPTNAFRCSVRVTWGHLDCNGHMGYQWFPQHAFNAIVLAVTSQETEAMVSLKTANIAAGVNSFSVVYLKECCHEDQLDMLANRGFLYTSGKVSTLPSLRAEWGMFEGGFSANHIIKTHCSPKHLSYENSMRVSVQNYSLYVHTERT
ncbi:hypothetical protein RRG08_027454 [Elysia crispata]|uniref:Uncharacterized protein n=1 Tax=Elysia crispata TaxID=231223 RepID=A0AAE1D2Z2_9GAST|nr:hypothetical protein RRG08_027454 [Elysia crispata]